MLKRTNHRKKHIVNALLASLLFFWISCGDTEEVSSSYYAQQTNNTNDSIDFVMCTEYIDYSVPPPNPFPNKEDYMMEAHYDLRYIWVKKKKLKVHFMDGDEQIQQRVLIIANEWSNYCGIRFEKRKKAKKSDIRVTFKYGGYGSFVGCQAKDKDKDKPTMCLENLDLTSDSSKFRRTILHEFGHALGLIHEHQAPNSPIIWNVAELNRYYRLKSNWKPTKVKKQIIDKYAVETTNNMKYDSASIMHYVIPKEVTLNNRQTSWREDLSDMDKLTVSIMYPK